MQAKQLFLLFALSCLAFSFSIDTVSPFPTTMYGGGSYSAQYHIDGNADYPFTAHVNFSDSSVTVPGCSYADNLWACNITQPYFNLTVNLPSTLAPGHYNITTQIFGDYNAEPGPAYFDDGWSGGGPIGNAQNPSSAVQPSSANTTIPAQTPPVQPQPTPTINPAPENNSTVFTNFTLVIPSQNKNLSDGIGPISPLGPSDNILFIAVAFVAFVLILGGIVLSVFYFRAPPAHD